MTKKTYYVQIFLLPFFLLSLLLPLNVQAHEGRHKNVTDQAGVTKLAMGIITSAIEENKIDASWKEAKILEVKTKNVNNTDEWMVTLQNKKIEEAKRKMYLFFSLDGKFLAMNYTGK